MPIDKTFEKTGERRNQHLRLACSATALSADRFEIRCINAGEGNGWFFSADVLKDSLPLWNGAHCFVDHAGAARSVRDMAGVISAARWDAPSQGIHATLQAFGAEAGLIACLARQILNELPENRPQIGFSADILFTAQGKQVEKILKVFSVDLVFDPARGGAFIRALNQRQNEGVTMSENLSNATPVCVEADKKPTEAALQTVADPTLALRLQLCQYLLDTALAAAHLPQPVTERLRKRFAARVFDAAELKHEIEDARQMVSDLTASATVQGPAARVSAVFNSTDRLQAAVDDLFGVPRTDALKNVQTARLSGIRELYLMLTGDHDLHGGFRADRVQLATTADFTGLVKNALNKLVVSTWEELGRAGYDWWQNISTVEHFGSLNDITGTLVGTVGDLPSIAEGDDYTQLEVGDSPETASFVKYGGYIPLTLELIDRDETRKLKAYARELASAGLRKVSRLVAGIFTANSAAGPIMADGAALFNNTPVTSAGGHANLRNNALSAGEWDMVSAAVYAQPMLVKKASGFYGVGPALAINPKFLLVPRALQKTAYEILQANFAREESYMYDNVLKGSGVPVVVPEWTDGNDWAAACDPRVAPAIYIGERFGIMPEVFIAGDELSPAVFSNDEHRLKVRHYLAVWVNDFRPLHKNNAL